MLETEHPSIFLEDLQRRLVAGLERIIVLAGDGTVQALVDFLAHLPSDIPRPQLLVLAGGRTNLTARDLDGEGDVLGKIESVLERHAAGVDFQLATRTLLAIEQKGEVTRHGFFIAGGWVEEVIRSVHRHRDGGGAVRLGAGSTIWHLSTLALRALGNRSRLSAPVVQLETTDGQRMEAAMRIFLATSLEHRAGLYDPYADRGDGALRFTAIAEGARRFWWTILGVVCGRFAPWMNSATGYLSGRCGGLTLHGLQHYALDGEEFEVDPAVPLAIRYGPKIEFLLP